LDVGAGEEVQSCLLQTSFCKVACVVSMLFLFLCLFLLFVLCSSFVGVGRLYE
jgi:hypothetical protein